MSFFHVPDFCCKIVLFREKGGTNSPEKRAPDSTVAEDVVLDREADVVDSHGGLAQNGCCVHLCTEKNDIDSSALSGQLKYAIDIDVCCYCK